MDAVWTWDEDRKCLKTVHVDKYGVETVIERTMDEDKADTQVGEFCGVVHILCPSLELIFLHSNTTTHYFEFCLSERNHQHEGRCVQKLLEEREVSCQIAYTVFIFQNPTITSS